MKNLIKKARLFLLSIALIGCSIFPSYSCFACEQPVTFDDSITELTNATDIENAISLLGLSDEEAQNVTLYQTTSSGPDVLEHGVTQMPTFRLYSTSSNRGRDRIFNGTKLKVAVVVTGTPGDSLHFTFFSYDNVFIVRDIDIGDDGRGVYNGSWFDIRYGGTYFARYERGCCTGNYVDITVVFAVY